MRIFATPGLCPGCVLPQQGTPHCPQCGLPQQGGDAARLRFALQEADRLMQRLDVHRVWDLAPAAEPGPEPAPALAPPVLPPPRYDAPARPGISIGAVLLGLGALCLVVAGVVFVAVTWGSLSLTGRTLVLLGVTGVAFGATATLTARRLHGSVEAVSAVAWLFLAVDVIAARKAGLGGLDTVDLLDLVTVSGLVVAVTASVTAFLTHRLVGREPYMSASVAAVGWWLVGASTAWQSEIGTAWTLVVLVLAGVTLSLVYRAAGSRITLLLLAGSTLALHMLLWLEAFRIALSTGTRGLLQGGRLWPVLVALVLTVLAAELVRRRQPGDRSAAVVHGAGLVTALLAAVVVVVPACRVDPAAGVVALALVTLTLASAGLLRSRPWTAGPRALVPVAAGACLLAALPWVTVLGLDLATLVATPWGHPVDATLPGVADGLGGDLGLPPWTASVGLLCVALTGGIVAAWDRVPLPVPLLRTAALLVAWSACALTVSVATASLPVVVASVVLPALVPLAVTQLRDGDTVGPPMLILAATGLASSCLLAAASVGLSLVVWSSCLVVALLMALWSAHRTVAGAWAAGAVLLGTGVTGSAVELLGGDAGGQALTLAVVLALTLLATLVLPADDSRLGVVGGVALMSVVPFVLAVGVGLARTSLVLTLLGATAVAVGLLDARRRPSALVGSVTLAAAWWLRLVASDIDVVETYTLLPAVALLAVGLVPVLRRAAPTVPSLMPGLTLAIVPSLPLTVLEPGSLRGLLVLAAAAVLLGAGTMLRWAAPFTVGAVVVALVALVHLGPYLAQTPRWAALAALGLVMLAVGVTWESRVRDLRSAAAYVGALR